MSIQIFANQSRKLSEIALNLERFLPSEILLWQPCQNLYLRNYHAYLTERRLVKFREVTPTSPKLQARTC